MTREEAVAKVAEKMAEEYFDAQEIGPVTHYVEPILREFERATLERAARVGDALSAAYITEAKKFDVDEPGNPRAQFAAWSTGARDTARGIRSLMEEA